MAAWRMLIAFAGVLVVGGAEVPSLGSCEISVASMGANDFLAALEGGAGCVDADPENKESCCDQARRLFGEGGRAEFCLCNVDFFSAMLMVVPDHTGLDPSNYADMLEECAVPVVGKLTCPEVGEETPVEPVVQSQIAGALVLSLLASSGGRSRSRKPRSSPSPTSPSPPSPPPSPPSPAVVPAGFAGGKSKVVVPEKLVIAAPVEVEIPAPKKVEIAAPVESEVSEPKTVIAVTPKQTAGK